MDFDRRILIVCAATLLVACGRNAGSPTPPKPAQFQDVASDVGLRFTHYNGAEGRYFMPEIVGSGVAVFDYDGDGDMDIFLVQGDVVGAPPRGPGHRLFRNELIPGGSLRFTDVTTGSGLGRNGVGMGVAVGDFDNDGLPDLYVTAYGPNRLFRNLGNGQFADVTATAGVEVNLWSTSALFFDYDRDGWQDLFVSNYVDFSPAIHKNCKSPLGQKDYCGPQVYHGLQDRLFRNLHNGRFEDVSSSAGFSSAPGPGLGVVAFDANGDDWPDLFVANDGKPNHLWLNQHNGKFRESGLELGTAMAESGVARAGMGVAVAEINEDGKPVVVVANLTNEGATLYGSEGDKGFFDVSNRYGVHGPTVGRTSFGVGWFDSLNRGVLDLFFANGAVKIEPGAREGPEPYRQKNLILSNQNGRFVDVSNASGPALALEEVSRSAAFTDIDNDGDIDIVVTNNGGPVRLLLNQHAAPLNHWLIVRVDAGPSNRLGAGTSLELVRPGLPTLHRLVQTGYGYLTANDPRVHFGLGGYSGPVSVKAIWPDGRTELFPFDAVDRIVTIRKKP